MARTTSKTRSTIARATKTAPAAKPEAGKVAATPAVAERLCKTCGEANDSQGNALPERYRVHDECLKRQPAKKSAA